MGVSTAVIAGLASPRRAFGRPSRDSDPPVVVVGAGVAGLLTAYRLRQRGVPVRVLEAGARIGGRVLSLPGYFAGGQVAELGGEWIGAEHGTMRRLVAELGLSLEMPSDACIPPDVGSIGRRTEDEIAAALRRLWPAVDAAVASFGVADVTVGTPGAAEALDRLPLAAWLARTPMEPWLRDRLDAAAVAEFGRETAEQSTLNLLSALHRSAGPRDDRRFRVRGGNGQVARGLADALDVEVERLHALEAIRARAGGGYVLHVRKAESTSVEVRASHVVLALPFAVLRTVEMDVPLPPAQRRAIDELGYGTHATLAIGFGSQPWREGAPLDLPFPLAWETSQESSTGILTRVAGGREGIALSDGTPAMQAARVLASLESACPGATAAHSGHPQARMHWPSRAWARGSRACYLPGQWTSLRGAESTASRALFFAGEHTSPRHQGLLEGAAESGERAAREVLASLP